MISTNCHWNTILENFTKTSSHTSSSATSRSSALEDAGTSFICFSVNPPQLPTLPHWLHFASPRSELSISNYCQTVHTPSVGSFVSFFVFPVKTSCVHCLSFSFSGLLQNFICLPLGWPILASWIAAGEVSGFCYHSLLGPPVTSWAHLGGSH